MDRTYITLLGELRIAASREIDRAQVGEPPSRDMLKAMQAVIEHRFAVAVEEDLRS